MHRLDPSTIIPAIHTMKRILPIVILISYTAMRPFGGKEGYPAAF